MDDDDDDKIEDDEGGRLQDMLGKKGEQSPASSMQVCISFNTELSVCNLECTICLDK